MKNLANSSPIQTNEKKQAHVENEIHAKYAENEDIFYERLLKATKTPVILYLHGNTGSRAASHRVEMYQLLRNLGYHVIAFDYRGYGDSTRIGPTESGVVRDAIAVYNYILSVTKSPIIAWGHSLGE